MEEERVLDISWGTILKITIVFLSFYIVYLVRDVLVSILFALIISILFNPAIDFLQRRKVPRVLGTILVYTSFFAIFGALLYWLIPVFAFEIQQFTQLFPQYFGKLAPPLEGLGIEAFKSFEAFTETLQDWLNAASSSMFGALIAIFGGLISSITIFAMAIFFSIEDEDVKGAIRMLSPKGGEPYFSDLWNRCQLKTSAWFGTRILSSLFVGLISFITLEIFKIDYSFTLALFAGMVDVVPILGPIFAGIIITILTGLDSWIKAMFVLIAFVMIQQIEGNIVTPILTKKMVGLPAILVLIALLLGGRLWGILGAVLAIPLTSVVYEFLRDFLKRRKEKTNSF